MLQLAYKAFASHMAAHAIHVVWPTGIDADEQFFLPLGLRLEPYCLLVAKGSLWSSGAFSYTMSRLSPETSMGRYCSVAEGVTLFASEHPVSFISTSPFSYAPDSTPIFQKVIDDCPQPELYAPCAFDNREHAPLHIGHDVWIGQGATIKKGLRIGNGAVVAAGAVVTKDVEDFTIVGGVPARVIRRRFADEVIRRIRRLRWWRYRFTDFHGLDPAAPDRFLDGLERKIEQGSIAPYEPEAVTLASIKGHLAALPEKA